MGIFIFANIHWFLMVPLYLCLSPICMISSKLFDYTMSYIIDDQTLTLFVILSLECAVSVALIFQLIWDRTGKSIFFYEFVLFLTCSNSILIGVTYSLLQRQAIYEELMAKICSTLLLILAAEKMKIKFTPKKEEQCTCVICFNELNDECIHLKCKHVFHETCLWNWAYQKSECPTCKSPIYS